MIRPPKPDSTEGTATVSLTFKEGKQKITHTIHGCIVENDANLQSFIQNNIKQSADKEKFKNAKYFFYAFDPDFKEERTYIKTSVAYHRFSKPGKPKSYILNCSLHNFVKVQQHIFLLCDSRELDKSDFLKKHSKKIRESQSLSTFIYGLICEEDEEGNDCLKFIMLNHVQKSFDVYGIDAAKHEKLYDAGPVLLGDKTTVVGSFEKKEDNEISIFIFGKNQDSEREVFSDFKESEEMESEQNAKESSHQEEELSSSDQKLEAKLDKEKRPSSPQSSSSLSDDEESEENTMDGNENTQAQSSSHEMMPGDPENNPKLGVKESEDDTKRDGNTIAPQLRSEKTGSQPEEGYDKPKMPKQGQEHEESPKFPNSSHDTDLMDQVDYSKNRLYPSKEGDPNCDNSYETFGNQENGGASTSCFHPTDAYEGFVSGGPVPKTNASAAQHDQQKTMNEEKALLTIPLDDKLQPSSYEEKLPSPIQVSCSDPDDCYNFLKEIKKSFKDGSNHMHDDLRENDNKKKYTRFLLHVAQNAPGKMQEIGEALNIPQNKLDILKADLKSESTAEKNYQMLVLWIESDQSKPTLEKLLVALGDTNLVEVAERVSDMLTDNRSHGGKTVTEKLFNKITKDVKDVWKFLGRYLGMDEDVILSIKADYSDHIREQTRQMLNKWKQSMGSRAKTGYLINALNDVGKRNVARTVEVWER